MNPYAAYSDQKLVDLLKEGDRGAFGEIYSRYWDPLFNAAHKRLGNLELCEELVQDVFVSAWERRFALAINTGLAAYLHTAVKYKVIDHYRKRITESDFLDELAVTPANYQPADELVILRDLKRHLDLTVEQLPPKCRSVYRLSRYDHKSNKEIASIMSISEKTVEGHLTKAIQMLRLNMAEYLTVAIVIFFEKKL